MAKPVDDDLVETVERLTELRSAGLHGIGLERSSRIVQQRLHVLDRRGERERRNAAPSP